MSLPTIPFLQAIGAGHQQIGLWLKLIDSFVTGAEFS